MPLIASNTSSAGPTIPLCEPGIFAGVCAHVCDLGQTYDQHFGKWKHEAVLLFEIDQLITLPGSEYDGKRYMLSLKVTVTLGEKANLRRLLNGWRGRALTDAECAAFDLERLKGKTCMVTVTANAGKQGKEYRNISALAPLMKGQPALTPETLNVPGWVAKQKAANDMAWEAYQATLQAQGDHEPVVIEDERPQQEIRAQQAPQQLPPANMARPAQRLVTEGRVPLSQPVHKAPDSPPPGPGHYDDEPPF